MRHGESTANEAGVLAGRDDTVDLTDRGLVQVREARALVPELTGEKKLSVFSSPIHRCVRTAEELVARDDGQGPTVPFAVLDDLSEVDYGDWTGRSIRALLKEPLWETVRRNPSLAQFPGGESLTEVAARARRALTGMYAAAKADEANAVVLVSHGDVIKLMLAHALGLDVDLFQRIAVAPASVSRFVIGKADSVPPMTVTMVGATSRGRRAEARAPGGGR